MKGRQVAVVVGVVCAFAASGLTAASASAATTGTTTYTCKSTPGTGSFSDAHCLKEAGSSNYSHVIVAVGKETELGGTNAGTCAETAGACSFQIHSVISGVNVEISANVLSLTGSTKNGAVGEEHQATGTGVLTLSEVSVSVPAGKGCKVIGGSIVSQSLTLSTVGVGMSLKLAPKEGVALAKFEIEGCAGTKAYLALNGAYELTGSVNLTPSGATIGATASATTTQATLKLRGQNAGIEGQLTLSGRSKSGESFTPLAATTPGEGSPVEEHGFAADSYPATVNGNQAVQHSFAAGTKEIECTEAAFPGTLSAISSTVTLFPEYKSCRTELNLPTTATMNGCSYVLHSSGRTSISCPAGKKIQFHVFESEKKHLANEALCTYSIPPQGPIGDVVYEPEGSGSTADLLIKYKVSGISYEVEGPKLQCGSSASNGEYTGSSTETAKNEKGEQIGFFLK